MPRGPRLYLPNLPYHVICRGNNRQAVFIDQHDFIAYLTIARRYRDRDGLQFHHWVLMSNHVHLLVTPGAAQSLAKSMQGINLAYSLWHARKYRRVGHLWQDRFRSIPIEEDTYLLECGRYIERNPVRALLTEHPDDYPWSSYAVHARGIADGLTTPHELYLSLAHSPELRQRHYREYVASHRDREEEELRQKMTTGYLGGAGFRLILQKQTVAQRKPRPGRPPKIACNHL